MKRLTSDTAVASTSCLPSPVAATIPDSLRNFDALPASAYVRLPVVTGVFACSPATVWRRVKKRTLPAPRKLSEGVTAWNVGQIRQALNGEAWE